MYKTDSVEILIPEKHHQIKCYGPEEVLVNEDGQGIASTLKATDLSTRIEEIWDKKYKEAIRTGKNLFPGALYRLVNCKATNPFLSSCRILHRLNSFGITGDNKLYLTLGPTNYREHMGTNVEARLDSGYMQELIDRGIELFKDKDAFFANALGITSITETSDGIILMGLRSEAVAEYPLHWQPPAGHPKVGYDLFYGMKDEIVKETGITIEEIRSIHALGIIRNIATRKPDMVFYTKLNVPFEGIVERTKKAEEAFEHKKFCGVPSIAEEIMRFLTLKPLAPAGEGALILYLMNDGVDVEKELPQIIRKIK